MLMLLSGCAAKQRGGDITVFADRSMQNCLSALGDEFSKESGVAVSFSFGGSGELAEELRQGRQADLVIIEGEPLMSELQKEKVIDNYLIFASDPDVRGAVYTMAKPVKSRKYDQAQRFADVLRSDKGSGQLEKYGFKPIKK